ncbi:MAG TPA: PTS sugar transporter subunit IIA [Alcanivoracaceae bacterium]|nr:PTS sugar transporter subunit IIA [Alcanivoracaceae bacterium]
MRDLLTPENTFHHVPGVNKKRLLEDIAERITAIHSELNTDTVFESLLARERLGSTGIGEGIALPHCRLDACTQPMALLITLDEAIDFEASDNQPVDIAFMLIVPNTDPEQHFNTLSYIANLFGQSEYRKALRNAASAKELFEQAVNSRIELELIS